MDTGAWLVALALLILTVPLVFKPLSRAQSLKRPQEESSPDLAQNQRRMLLMDIRDLDFDFRTGKVPEEDYLTLRSQFLVEAARMTSTREHADDALEREIASRRLARSQERTCRECKGKLRPEDSFCPSCGEGLSSFCHSCGKELLSRSRFCSYCGTAVAVSG